MKLLLEPFTLDDIGALVVIVGCLVLIFTGADGQMKGILGVAAGWLFGKRISIGGSKDA